MKGINYHHLLYFWTVARTGTVTAASVELGLAQPTVSAQIRQLEQSLGHRLFQQSGRTLELTEKGQLVFRYASEIFSLGKEMLEALEGRGGEHKERLRVGVADVLPKMVVSRVLRPVLAGSHSVHLVCFEGKPLDLLGRLVTHELDLVLSDTPVGPEVNVRAYNHLLGECAVGIFAPAAKARHYAREFPQSLDGAPFVLPTANTALRRMLEFWFSARQIHPRVIAEFEDSALLKAFTLVQDVVLFPAPVVVAAEIEDQYNVRKVGEIAEVQERFYAISCERKVRHSVVALLIEEAQRRLFP